MGFLSFRQKSPEEGNVAMVEDDPKTSAAHAPSSAPPDLEKEGFSRPACKKSRRRPWFGPSPTSSAPTLCEPTHKTHRSVGTRLSVIRVIRVLGLILSGADLFINFSSATSPQHMAHLRNKLVARGGGAVPDAVRHQYFCRAPAHGDNHRCIQHHWRPNQAAPGQDPRYMGPASGSQSHASLLGPRLCHDGSLRQCANIRCCPGLLHRGVSDNC